MPQISIIIPVYNVEKYLKKCLQSVINQTLEDIEILLVDDGSTDDSGTICDEFAKKDNRIKVIHKKNEGVSKARNDALKIAQGTYIGFVDADDFIESDMFETLYFDIKSKDFDLSICNRHIYYEDGKVYDADNTISGDKMELTVKAALQLGLKGGEIRLVIWDKLYKRELIKGLIFSEQYSVAEDSYFVLQYLLGCKSIVYNNRKMYFYRQRIDSCTNEPFTIKDLDIIKVYIEVYDLLLKQFSDLEDLLIHRQVMSHIYVVDKIMISSNYDKNKYLKTSLKFLRSKFIKIVLDREFRIKRKCSIVLLLCNKHIYHYFYMKYIRGKF